MQTYYFIRSVPLLVGVEAESEKEAWELAAHRVDDFMTDALSEVAPRAHVSEGSTQEGDEYFITYQGDAIYASQIPGASVPDEDEGTYPDPHADTNGISLVGALDPITYPELVAKLGDPHFGVSGDDKVDAEWVFTTPAGVTTIYNYKSGPAYNPGENIKLEDVDDWHIGGHSVEVLPYIKQYVASR